MQEARRRAATIVEGEPRRRSFARVAPTEPMSQLRQSLRSTRTFFGLFAVVAALDAQACNDDCGAVHEVRTLQRTASASALQSALDSDGIAPDECRAICDVDPQFWADCSLSFVQSALDSACSAPQPSAGAGQGGAAEGGEGGRSGGAGEQSSSEGDQAPAGEAGSADAHTSAGSGGADSAGCRGEIPILCRVTSTSQCEE